MTKRMFGRSGVFLAAVRVAAASKQRAVRGRRRDRMDINEVEREGRGVSVEDTHTNECSTKWWGLLFFGKKVCSNYSLQFRFAESSLGGQRR
jgi:hypothetical protein